MPFRGGRALVASVLLAICCVAPDAASAATRLVSTNGADSGSCVAGPCRSLGYAYRQAQPGDAIELAGGRYPSQSIPKASGRGAPVVEIRPAAAGVASVAGLDILADHLLVRGLSVSGGLSIEYARDVKLVELHGRTVWIQDAHDVAFLGGSYGGNVNAPTVQTAADVPSTDLLFDGVDFHDARATDPDAHMECIWAGGVRRFTVRNSIFRNCAYFDIFFTRLNGPDPRDVLLENNVFEVTKQHSGKDAPYAINIANWLSKVENFTIRNNSFGGDLLIQPSVVRGTKVTGNVGPISGCKNGVTYSHNVFTAARCSASDKRAPEAMSQFVSPAGHDWRLAPGAAAIDAGDPTDFPATDRAGLTRSGAPDAGAHEHGGTPGSGGEAGVRIVAARLLRSRICRRPARLCPVRTLLRLRLSRSATATVSLRRVAAVRRATRAGWRMTRAVRGRARSLRIGARGRASGRYRLVIGAVDATGRRAEPRRLTLRVI